MRLYFIGHRGFGKNSYNKTDIQYVENTEYVIRKAYNYGIRTVEIDIHMQENGDLIINHDLPDLNNSYPLLKPILKKLHFIDFNIEIKTNGNQNMILFIEKLKELEKSYKNIKFFSTFNFELYNMFKSEKIFLLIDDKNTLNSIFDNQNIKIICDIALLKHIKNKKQVVGFYGDELNRGVNFKLYNEFDNLEFFIVDKNFFFK